MDNKYYNFTSNGYLVTLAVAPVFFEKAIASDDWSEDGGRMIYDHLIRGEHRDYISFPVDFIVTDGKKLRDVIEMRYPFGFLISERIKTIFECAGLTGWRTYDVTVHKNNGEEIPGYYGFQVTGKCSTVIPGQSEQPSDFFRPDSWYYGCVCTQKVIDVLRANHINDFDICPISDSGKVIPKKISIR